MSAIGIGAVLIGYSIGLYGYILIRGYDVGFTQLFLSTWPPAFPAKSIVPTTPKKAGQ